MTQRTGPEVMAAIARIAKVIREEAGASERLRRASPNLVDALHRERLFRLWIPASLDGDELDLVDSLRAFEEVSRLDGSAGWTVMIGVGGGPFATLMAEEAAREVFLRPDALIAGSGSARGTAEVVEGGYLAGGSWSYASGAHQATSFTANCVLTNGGEPLHDGQGDPRIRAMTFPAASVHIYENWEVLGMRGTGSHDFRVAPPVFVPEAFSFSTAEGAPDHASPLFSFPFMAIAPLSFAAVALGIAAHAGEAFAHLAAEKSLYGSKLPLISHRNVQAALGEAAATLGSARGWFYQTAERAWATVSAGRTLSEADMEQVRKASVHAARASARAADMLFELARTEPIRDGDELGRAWRDVHVVRQHAALSPLASP